MWMYDTATEISSWPLYYQFLRKWHRKIEKKDHGKVATQRLGLSFKCRAILVNVKCAQVCMCVCALVYAWVHVCILWCRRICMRACLDVCVCMCVWGFSFLCVCICVYILTWHVGKQIQVDLFKKLDCIYIIKTKYWRRSCRSERDFRNQDYSVRGQACFAEPHPLVCGWDTRQEGTISRCLAGCACA